MLIRSGPDFCKGMWLPTLQLRCFPNYILQQYLWWAIFWVLQEGKPLLCLAYSYSSIFWEFILFSKGLFAGSSNGKMTKEEELLPELRKHKSQWKHWSGCWGAEIHWLLLPVHVYALPRGPNNPSWYHPTNTCKWMDVWELFTCKSLW